VGDNIQQDVFFFFPSQVLALFNAPAGEYACVFTAGATSALKLVGETFPWSSKSEYLYMMQRARDSRASFFHLVTYLRFFKLLTLSFVYSDNSSSSVSTVCEM
jgi:hypothetical protein